MNARLNNLVERAKNPRDKNFRNHIYIFLICFGISLFIWFLIKISDDYVSDISIPVTYTNVPADKQLNNSGDRISVRIRGNGGDLFSVKYISRGKLELNLSQVEIKKSMYFDRYYFLTARLVPKVSERFDFDHTLISISPDTIFLDLEDIISRKLKIKTRLDVKCKPQYMLYDSITAVPSDIMVSGPASTVDTLKYIETEARSLTELDRSQEISVPIVRPVKDDKVRYSEEEIKIIIPVEEFTESSVELPVYGRSTDSGVRSIRTFPETVHVVYQVAIKDYGLVKPEMFMLSVEYDPQKDKEKKFLKVRIDKSPDFVRITRLQPDKLEYIIQN